MCTAPSPGGTYPDGDITHAYVGPKLVSSPKCPTADGLARGFQPGEVDTTTLLGRPVRIRPTLKGYTYHGGEYSLGGGPWIPIPGIGTANDTVTVPGPPQTLTVKTSRPRLVIK